jgi:hypothetical protein
MKSGGMRPKGNSLKKLGRSYEIAILEGIKKCCCSQINSDITLNIWQKLPKKLDSISRVAKIIILSSSLIFL